MLSASPRKLLTSCGLVSWTVASPSACNKAQSVQLALANLHARYLQHCVTFQGERDMTRISIENSINFLLFWPEIIVCLWSQDFFWEMKNSWAINISKWTIVLGRNKHCFSVSLPGNFVQGYKTVFNFITSMIEAVKGNIILRVPIRTSCYPNYQELSVQLVRQFCHWVKEIFMRMFSTPPGQSVSLDSAYHSLNRTILFQLSRPLARLTGEQVD